MDLVRSQCSAFVIVLIINNFFSWLDAFFRCLPHLHRLPQSRTHCQLVRRPSSRPRRGRSKEAFAVLLDYLCDNFHLGERFSIYLHFLNERVLTSHFCLQRWIPEFIAPLLTGISIFCLARRNSAWVSRIFGVSDIPFFFK